MPVTFDSWRCTHGAGWLCPYAFRLHFCRPAGAVVRAHLSSPALPPQVLEGFPEAVSRTFAHLQREPHHTGCVVLLDVRCTERQFMGWHLSSVTGAAGRRLV